MQIKDYRRLAKISLKSRKKSTRSTVMGIAFGLILLMPIIFLGVGLNADLKATINETPELLYSQIEHHSSQGDAPDDIGTADQYYQNGLLGSASAAKLSELGEYTVQYKLLKNRPLMHDNSSAPYIKYSIGDSELVRAPRIPSTSNQINSSMAVLSGDNTTVEYVIDSYLLEGYDAGFNGDGKGQIMLNEQFIKALGLEFSQVYNKEFSLYYRDQGDTAFKTYDNDNDPNNTVDKNNPVSYIDAHLFKKYKVVGIVKGVNSSSSDNTSIIEQAMITTDASLYNESGEVFAPVYNLTTVDYGGGETSESYVATYDMTDDEITARSDEYIRTGIGAYYMMEANYNYYGNGEEETPELIDTQYTRIQAKDYAALDDIVNSLTKDYEYIFGNDTKSYFMNSTSQAFSTFNMVYTIFNYAFLVLFAVGGIILFSAIVNLFNTIMHSVQSRKNYLGVMRAIGAPPSTIPKLYLFETMRIFRRALTWVLFIGCGMCVGIKIGLDLAFGYLSESLGVTLGISWAYIPIAFGGLVLLLAICGVAFSYFCSRKISKQAITQVLEG